MNAVEELAERLAELRDAVNQALDTLDANAQEMPYHVYSALYDALDADGGELDRFGGWISAADRLPPDGEYVLAACRSKHQRGVHRGFYDGNSWRISGGYTDVSHWMPLPCLPPEPAP